MANALYPKGKEGIGGAIDLLADDIKVALMDASYVYSSSHQYLTSVLSALNPTPAVSLTSKTITNGVFNADNAVFFAVSGGTVSAAVIYRNTGLDATSELLAYYNVAAAGLPLATTGGDVTITWSTGANKIFAL